ncbi:hypothetical protein GCM10028810_02040 [Spirosoma litoris]
MIPASQLASIIKDAVAAGIAAHTANEKALAQDAATEAAKKAVGVAPSLPVADDLVTESAKKAGLFGNKDKKKEFDLSKLLPTLKELPKDKYVIVIQKHDVLSDKSVREDTTARRAQIIEPAMYDQSIKPNKTTGEAPYDVLFGKPGDGGGYVTVHEATEVDA